MFTGIVEELGEVTALEIIGDAARLSVRGPVATSDAALGASIAVNGCCLTVADLAEGVFTADLMAETLAKTSLGGIEVGSRVNLERSVPVTGRLGGHIVQGHVDGTGTIRQRVPGERWEVVEIAVPVAMLPYLAAKGSVAVDGVSLTIVEVSDADASFTVSLIPETLARTTLGLKQVGTVVNIELDVIAKYVERLLNSRSPSEVEALPLGSRSSSEVETRARS